MPLTLQALINNGLLDELAACFANETDATLLLAAIGFPPAFRPNFQRTSSPMDFWLTICTQLENGRVANGFEQLLAQAAAKLPANRVFAPFAQPRPLPHAQRVQPGHPATIWPDQLAGEYDVFLSFSSRDRDLVLQIARSLATYGIRPWLDEWALPLGRPISPELERILSSARAVAVIYGTDGYGPWQQAEVDVALERALRGQCLLIPVMLPGVAPADLPPFLRRYRGIRILHSVNLAQQDAVARLAEAILAQRGSNP
jgi:hypothetical protein